MKINFDNSHFEPNRFSYFTYVGFLFYICSIFIFFELLALLSVPTFFVFPDVTLFFYLLVPVWVWAFMFVLFTEIITYNSEKICSEACLNPNRVTDKTKDHHAILIAISTKRNKQSGSKVGSDLLIDLFTRRSIPFNIYLCNPSTAESVISSQKTKFIYLFGHGKRGNLTFYLDGREKPDFVYYKNFINSPKKEFISQLHCNRGQDPSLCDILILNKKPCNCFILTGKIFGINFRQDIWLSVRFFLLKKIVSQYEYSV